MQPVKKKVRFSKFSLQIKFKFIFVMPLLTKQIASLPWVECKMETA